MHFVKIFYSVKTFNLVFFKFFMHLHLFYLHKIFLATLVFFISFFLFHKKNVSCHNNKSCKGEIMFVVILTRWFWYVIEFTLHFCKRIICFESLAAPQICLMAMLVFVWYLSSFLFFTIHFIFGDFHCIFEVVYSNVHNDHHDVDYIVFNSIYSDLVVFFD